MSVPPTITRVSLSVAISNPSIVIVKAPSCDTPAESTSYLKSSASAEAVIVDSDEASTFTTVYDEDVVESVDDVSVESVDDVSDESVDDVSVESVDDVSDESVDDVSVEVSDDVSATAGSGAGSSPIDDPNTIFKFPCVSATPSRVIVELDPSEPGAK